MDPSIVKLLEEDEDETLHSGADLEAFTSALSRDIGNCSASDAGNSSTSNLLQWQTSHGQNTVSQNLQDSRDMLQKGQNSSEMMSGQWPMLNRMSDQRPKSSQPMVNAPKKGPQLSLGVMVPYLQTQVDKDRGMQLEALYHKLKQNEISTGVFVKHMKTIVGDHMLKMAAVKLQYQTTRNTETGPSKLPMRSQASAQQTLPNVKISTDVNNLRMDSRECRGDLQGTPENRVSSSGLNAIKQEKEHLSFPIQGLSKLQQQHLHFPRASFPTYVNNGNNNNNNNTKPQQQDLPVRPIYAHHSIGAAQLRPGTYTMNMMSAPNTTERKSSVQWQSSTNKEHRNISMDFPTLQHKSQISSPSISVQGGSTLGTSKDLQSSRMGFSTSASDRPSNFRSTPMPAQVETSSLLNSSKPRVASPNEPGNNGKNPLKNPSVAQKRPLETLSSLPPPSSKKQKAAGDILGQSIEQLNDVTAVSGVNLREEEEQLLFGANADGRVSEASKQVVQEEEERLILQKIPLQKKLTEIMRKCGLKDRSSNVERCISLCVEERMRVLLTSLIRFSKQRVDIEKLRHRTIPTSDVRKQIMVINERAKEEWEKKQAEIAKFQVTNESEDDSEADGDKKDGKSAKVPTKGEDEKTRATAANIAARVAIGGDDMLSKWQLMAEQARQKRQGSGLDSQSRKDVSQRPVVSTLSRNAGDRQEAEKAINTPTGTGRKFGKNEAVTPQIARTITIKDVMAALEMEPQMSKSTLVYRLYERNRFDSSTA